MQKRRNAERLAHVILIVGILSLLGALFLYFTGNRSLSAGSRAAERTSSPIVQPPLIDRPRVQGNAMGDPDALVKIVEFSDFLCPYCRQFFLQTEQPLIEDYVATGKVYFVYRTLGDWLGPESQASAEAAYCASGQGKFWEYHDLLLANQGSGSFSRDRLRAFAQALALDEEDFNACLSSARYRDQVQ